MNPLVLEFANGNAFFVGMGLTATAFTLRLWLRGRLPVLVLTATWLLGISFVILSATPMSVWLYGLWFGLCVVLRVASGRPARGRLNPVLAAVFAVFSLALCLAELPYHLTPSIHLAPDQPVYVLGDSLSAGIGRGERLWPDILGDRLGLRVTNLAKAGATVQTASSQADGVTASNSLVLIEIGGNDFLGHTDSHTFRAQLDELLSTLVRRGNRLVMFELPLPPFCNSFGRAQRILAHKHGVILLPKARLTAVLSIKGNTLDGLHLSQAGHNALANSIGDLLNLESNRKL